MAGGIAGGRGRGRGGADDLEVEIMRRLDREIGSKIAPCKSIVFVNILIASQQVRSSG